MLTWYEQEYIGRERRAQLEQEAARDHLVRSLPRAHRSSAAVRLVGNVLCSLGAWLVATGNRLQTGRPAVMWEEQGL